MTGLVRAVLWNLAEKTAPHLPLPPPPAPQPFIVPYNWTLGQGRLLCIDHRCLVFTVLLKERFSRSHSTLCVSTVLRLSRRNQACSQEDAVRGECSFQIFSNLLVLVFWAPKLPYFKSFWQRIFSILQNIQQQQQNFHSYIGGQNICSIDDLRLYVWTGLYIRVCQKCYQQTVQLLLLKCACQCVSQF